MSKEDKEIFTTATGRLKWKETGKNGQTYWRYSLKGKEKVVKSKAGFLLADDKRPYMSSQTDEGYLAYHRRKMGLRSQYPNWNRMERAQWLEYYQRVLELTQTDADYKQYFEVTLEGIVQKTKRDVLQRKIDRSKEYPNGFTHDD